MTKDLKYLIGTGIKEEFYTLWRKSIMYDDNNRLVYYHISFIQNLSKTKEGAINKVKELGINMSPTEFSLNLRHLSKPSLEAYGVNLKYKKSTDKWYGLASEEFFQEWRRNKVRMKEIGWSCWKYEDKWYMSISPKING